VSVLRADPSSATRTAGPTVASVWRALADGSIPDELLQWPADVFALSDVLLVEAQAFSFALSPPRAAPRRAGANRRFVRLLGGLGGLR
jgi:hypothetical protein